MNCLLLFYFCLFWCNTPSFPAPSSSVCRQGAEIEGWMRGHRHHCRHCQRFLRVFSFIYFNVIRHHFHSSSSSACCLQAKSRDQGLDARRPMTAAAIPDANGYVLLVQYCFVFVFIFTLMLLFFCTNLEQRPPITSRDLVSVFYVICLISQCYLLGQ